MTGLPSGSHLRQNRVFHLGGDVSSSFKPLSLIKFNYGDTFSRILASAAPVIRRQACSAVLSMTTFVTFAY